MCFSATASFITGSILVPTGLYALGHAYRGNPRYLALASFPLLFGIQQVIEGGLWLAMDGSISISIGAAALGFLAFAYFLWPFYVPLAAYNVEDRPRRRRIFAALAWVGFVFGASLYVPLLMNQDWIVVSLSSGSILYEPVLIYDGYVPRSQIRVFYALIVAVPLLFSSVGAVRLFGILILASVIVSAIVFAYAFVSIWCFFAAILSFMVAGIVRRAPAYA